MRRGFGPGLNARTLGIAARSGGVSALGLTQNVVVAFVGDSTTNGSNGGSGGTSNYLNSRPNAPAIKTAEILNADGIPVTSEGTFGVGGNNTASVWVQADGTRYVSVGGWTSLANLAIFGGHFFQAAGAGAVLQVNILGCDVIKLAYPVWTYGSFRYRIDGGSWVTVNQTGTKVWQIDSIPVAMGDHTVEFEWVSGTAYMHCCYGENSTRNELRHIHAGARGALSSNFITNTSTNPWLFRNANGTLPIDIAVVNIGINDINTNVSLATYESNYRAFLTNWRTNNPDVAFILEKPNPISLDGTGVTQMQVRSLIDTLATDYSTGGKFCRVHDRWASMGVTGVDGPAAYTMANGLGLMSDTLHPNAAGYGLIAIGLAAVEKQLLIDMGLLAV